MRGGRQQVVLDEDLALRGRGGDEGVEVGVDEDLAELGERDAARRRRLRSSLCERSEPAPVVAISETSLSL